MFHKWGYMSFYFKKKHIYILYFMNMSLNFTAHINVTCHKTLSRLQPTTVHHTVRGFSTESVERRRRTECEFLLGLEVEFEDFFCELEKSPLVLPQPSLRCQIKFCIWRTNFKITNILLWHFVWSQRKMDSDPDTTSWHLKRTKLRQNTLLRHNILSPPRL